ncbi:MAG: hypothetical protein L0Y60_00720, partial [Beijerinckiaceae bacterium]|nr:hypothetical protein [Beijerinckiaceae bacterium]
TREGKTKKRKNPHKTHSLAHSLVWAAWCIARLGAGTATSRNAPRDPSSLLPEASIASTPSESFNLATAANHA